MTNEVRDILSRRMEPLMYDYSNDSEKLAYCFGMKTSALKRVTFSDVILENCFMSLDVSSKTGNQFYQN